MRDRECRGRPSIDPSQRSRAISIDLQPDRRSCDATQARARMKKHFGHQRISWTLFALAIAEDAVERPEPVAAVGFLGEPLGAQQIALLCVGSDDAEGNLT